jgi:hypothetical protein
VIYSPAAEVLVLEDDAESAEGNPIELNIYRLNPVMLTFLFNKYYWIPVIFITGMQYGISCFHIRQ